MKAKIYEWLLIPANSPEFYMKWWICARYTALRMLCQVLLKINAPCKKTLKRGERLGGVKLGNMHA